MIQQLKSSMMQQPGILHHKIIAPINTIGAGESISINITKQNLQHDVLNIIADGRLYVVMFGELYTHDNDVILDALCLLIMPTQANIGDGIIDSAFQTKDNMYEMYVMNDAIVAQNDTAFGAHLYHTTRQFIRCVDMFNGVKLTFWKRTA